MRDPGYEIGLAIIELHDNTRVKHSYKVWQRARSIRPKFPEIPVRNRMEQTFSGNSFRKFRFTSRSCPLFWKFGNSGNFLFHLSFPPGMNRPQLLWLWKVTRWRRVFRVDTSPNAKWSAIVQACSWSLHENVRICWRIVDWSFRISGGSVRPVCILSREKSS